jgi:hypothetical protein
MYMKTRKLQSFRNLATKDVTIKQVDFKNKWFTKRFFT